jgi:alkylated DNA repair dioxygenase AlkB
MIELCSSDADTCKNLLPYDGEAYYQKAVFSRNQADTILIALIEEIDWKHDELLMFGKKVITQRKVAWYGNEGIEYAYSKAIKRALSWTEGLLRLKMIIETVSNETYNSCLLNLYHNGTEAMGWHSDDEKELKQNGTIASLSFGVARKFVFRHKVSKEKVEIWLEPGSLLLMKGTIQSNWMHRLAPSKAVTDPRVNLTFRTIVT